MKYEKLNVVKVKLGQVGRNADELYIEVHYIKTEEPNTYEFSHWLGYELCRMKHFVVGSTHTIPSNMKVEEWIYQDVMESLWCDYYGTSIEIMYEDSDYLEEKFMEMEALENYRGIINK